ncbi:hypothetical protein O3P69_012470 [Scylla paramamosain]|uniref:Uncharacterized protein n=1 Tax=Scylla paramamosain TaxID=85552 RepID=A0AAW0SHA6_SCYPA
MSRILYTLAVHTSSKITKASSLPASAKRHSFNAPLTTICPKGKQFAYETLYGTLLFVRNGESKILCLSPDTLCPVEQASTHMNMRENRLYAFPHSPLKVGYSLLEFVFWYQFFNSVHDRFVVFGASM